MSHHWLHTQRYRQLFLTAIGQFASDGCFLFLAVGACPAPLTLTMVTAKIESCHVSDGLFSFQQRKEKRKRNAAKNRWFLDLLYSISVWSKTSLNFALPLRLTRSAAHSCGNVEVPASTFLRKSGSAQRSRRQCYICTTERRYFDSRGRCLLCSSAGCSRKGCVETLVSTGAFGDFCRS